MCHARKEETAEEEKCDRGSHDILSWGNCFIVWVVIIMIARRCSEGYGNILHREQNETTKQNKEYSPLSN